MKPSVLALGLLALCASAGRAQPEVLEVIYDRELIPEGIAISPRTGKLYLSSFHKREIVEFDPATGLARPLVKSGQYGYGQGVGLLIENGLLFALSGDFQGATSHAALLVLDPETGTLLHRYAPDTGGAHFFNDLAVSPSNEIYITDSGSHRIYRYSYPEGEFSVFFEHEEIRYPNGIALSADGTRLYIDSYTHGVRVLDLATMEILNPRHEASSGIGIDGLKYHDGALYAIRNGGGDKSAHGLIKIALNAGQGLPGEVSPLLLGHEKMDIPTTFCILANTAYILANSQLEALDQENNRIVDTLGLTNTYILKYSLDGS